MDWWDRPKLGFLNTCSGLCHRIPWLLCMPVCQDWLMYKSWHAWCISGRECLIRCKAKNWWMISLTRRVRSIPKVLLEALNCSWCSILVSLSSTDWATLVWLTVDAKYRASSPVTYRDGSILVDSLCSKRGDLELTSQSFRAEDRCGPSSWACCARRSNMIKDCPVSRVASEIGGRRGAGLAVCELGWSWFGRDELRGGGAGDWSNPEESPCDSGSWFWGPAEELEPRFEKLRVLVKSESD